MTVTRRSSVVVVSVVLHIAGLGALLIASALWPGLLPAPHRSALAWHQPRHVQLADIELPRARPSSPGKTTAAPIISAPPASTPVTAAPLEAASGIAVETGRESGRFTGGEPPAAALGIVEGTALGQIEAAPAEPPARREAIRLHSGINAPRKIVDAVPSYPEIAKASRVEGIVILEATISETGDVVSAQVLRSIALLDQAAIDAVRRWKFAPARLNGEAIPVVMTVTVNFRLH